MIGRLLMFCGFGWAVLGLVNLSSLFEVQSTGALPQLASFGLQYNMLVHILPGLLVGGLGYKIASDQAARKGKDKTE